MVISRQILPTGSGEDGDLMSRPTYADIFNCQIRSFHLNYLGVPIAASRLHVADWFRFEENG
jgi:hypothetical protein